MPASDPTSIPADVPEDAVDELYGLPLDEFTPRRDELAKELRRAGQRDAAAWVKGLRRPSASAWLVNQLARTRARERTELLRAGRELRDAHERVVAGDGDAGELRAAAEAEHAAASALASDAPGFLDREGHAPSRATLDRVAETIRAVALDHEARAGFEAGRLTRERAASGFGPFAGAAPAEPKPRGGGAGKRRKQAGAKAGGGRAPSNRGAKGVTDAQREARAEARAARDTARRELKEAKAAQRAHAREVKAAERELADARREAERAQRRLERATSNLEEARSRESGAESRVAQAEAELGD